MKLILETRGRETCVDVEVDRDLVTVTPAEGASHEVRCGEMPEGVADLEIGGSRLRVPYLRAGGIVELVYGGRTYVVEITDPVSRRSVSRQAQKSGLVRAPMVGQVTAVTVTAGQVVAAGDPIAVIEAMKVVLTLEAPIAGTIKSITVTPGDRLEHGAVIAEIEAPPVTSA